MILIIDYNMGNVASVKKAFKKISSEAIISKDKEKIKKAKYIVLPGVGAFGDGMKNLKKFDLIEPLYKKVIKEKTPFLGICLGMQLLAEKSFEFGEHHGLGWIRGEVIKLNTKKNLRLPHIGWNDIKIKQKNKIFKNITDYNFYFVHSYRLIPDNKSIITSTCQYGDEFASSIQQNNIFATQFHPEKSQITGLQLLKNFLGLPNYA
ncbi:imidazole glycerol phosphate synthase subunit HisH [bacterium]|nr:imidazole glycerol phosphate synthase subunit HisH [bacterium]